MFEDLAARSIFSKGRLYNELDDDASRSPFERDRASLYV